jgi:DNA polymerase I-like protein with 3'-5' exonuclease and polymerase domains
LGLAARPFLTVHDSVLFDVPIREFWQTARAIKTIMEGISFPWLIVPLVVDIEAGHTWGDLKSVDLDKKTVG